MICKRCETENPEEAVYCLHCGKRLDGKKYCPHCNALNPDEAVFCIACGARFSNDAQSDPQNAEAQYAETQPQSEEDQLQTPIQKPKEKRNSSEKVKYAFDLSGGICLMVAVFFSFVFVFCMGITATVSVSTGLASATVSVSETTMLWDYFGAAYDGLAETLGSMKSYSGYFEASSYIPVILTTVICAGTLISVLVCTIIAAVKYGRHFKHPEVNYAKPAIGAVLSFVLGGAAFLMINSTSLVFRSDVRANIHFSDATLAGIILSVLFLGFYCGSRVAVLGKEFATKKAVVNFVCAIVGILFAVLTAAFAASPSLNINLNLKNNPSISKFELNFFNSNELISNIFTSKETVTVPDNFIETFVVSSLAQGAQIALLVLAFILLIKRTGEIGGDSKSCLGISIATFVLATVYLVLSCVAIHFGNELMQRYDGTEISIAAAPIVAVIASAFALADSITQKVLLKKTAQPQR